MRSKLTHSLVLGIFFLSSLSSAKGTGGLVNNGTGFTEQTLHYGYNLLAPLILVCTNVENQCDLSPKQIEIAKKIGEILKERPDSAKILEFVSGAENPGLFDLGVKEPHRFAVTVNGRKGPIQFNTDIMNEIGTIASFTAGDAIQTLVHELGHKADEKGEVSHRVLDDLGARIRIQFEAGSLAQRLPKIGESVLMHVIRPIYLGRNPEYILKLNDHDTYNLSVDDLPIQACRSPNQFYLGVEVVNPAWSRVVASPGYFKAIFKSWFKVICQVSDPTGLSSVSRVFRYMMVTHQILLKKEEGRVKLVGKPNRELVEDYLEFEP